MSQNLKKKKENPGNNGLKWVKAKTLQPQQMKNEELESNSVPTSLPTYKTELGQAKSS
jgi:hypothetical protein